VSRGLAAVNVLLHDAVLVDADRRQEIERALVAGVDAVENETDDDLLPGRAALVPELGALEVDDVADVLHDAVQRSRRQHLVLVVVGDGDQQLRVAVVHGRAQIVAVLQRKLVGVAGGGRVAHVGELLAASLEVVAVLGLDRVLDGARDRVVGAEDGALDELDLAGGVALQGRGAAGRAAGLGALPPVLDGAGLAARVRRLGARRLEALLGRRVAERRGGGVGLLGRVAVRLRQAVLRRRADAGRVGAVRKVGRVLVAKGAVAGAAGVVVQQRLLDLVVRVTLAAILGAVSRAIDGEKTYGRLGVGVAVSTGALVCHGGKAERQKLEK
jgi:hypothetical protein